MDQIRRFLLLMTILCSCYAQSVPGPDNTTRQEGETNVLIHCPFSISSAPIWLINSTLFEPLSLKFPFLPIVTGINITIVELSYNSTTFQCFAPTGNGLQVEPSSIGILTVTKQDSYNPPKTEPQAQIVLDHRRFYFNATHKTIAWTFENNQSCTPPVVFTIDLLKCDSDDPVQTSSTQDMEFTFQSIQQKEEPMYFRISANDKDHEKCSVITTNFQVPSEPYVYSTKVSIPLGEGQCLEVPKVAKLQTLYAVWPSDDGADCICPICDDGKCVLSNCECYNTSMFQPELKLNSSTADNPTYSLCWSNLVIDRNNSKMFFFYEELSCAESDKSPFLSRKYDENSIFVLRGPPLPPALDATENDICFNSYSYYPIDDYIVTISDSTGERQSVNQSSKVDDPKTCFSLAEEVFPAECSPYKVIVVAHNKVGFSNGSNITVQEKNGDICLCMEHKIDIELSVGEITDSSVEILVNCTQILPSKFRNFAIGVTDDKSSSSQNVSLPCLTDLYYTNLVPNTTFNITVVWFDLTLPAECNIGEFTTLSGLPPAPLLNITEDTVCFMSNAYYPVTYYIIDVIDLMGENHSVIVNVSNPSSKETEACMSLFEAVFPSACSPYNVSIRAHNKVGSSNASNTTLIDNDGGDICSCMENKIDIKLSVSAITDTSVQISVNCTELLPSKFKDFAIKVTNGKSSSSQNISFPCVDNLQFTNLIPNTTFNIAVVWFDINQPAECNIEEFTTLSGLPPVPLLNITGDTVCFMSNAYHPVTYYTVDVIDLMGENHSMTINVSNPSSNEPGACTSLYEAAFPSECSPYNVSVRAHNKVGSSNASNTTLIENDSGDICSCMEHKLDIELSVSAITDTSVQISVNCTVLLPSKFKDFAIKVTNDESSSSQNVSVPCVGNLQVTNLVPNTTFNITVVWFDLTQSAECNIEEFTTLTGLPPVPLLNITGDTVCFMADAYYPVTYYTVNVIDLMGENHSMIVNVSNPSLNETEACTFLLETVFPSACSPYNVSVRAHNKVGSSDMSTTMLIENNGGDICSCMGHKIEVDVKALQISDSSIELRVNCSEQLPTEIDIFTVKLTSYGSNNISDSYSQNISLPCAKTMLFSKLTPDTIFSVKVVWYEHFSPAAIECALDNYTTLAGLPPSPPMINYTGDSLCYSSDSYYPIDYYIFELVDVTDDEQIFNETDPSGTDGCISLSETNFVSNCTPYYVIAKAHNKIGTSNASKITIGDNRGNKCLCMDEKVTISLDINEAIKTDSSIEFHCNCTKTLTLLSSSEDIDIVIELSSDNQPSHNNSMQCDSTSTKLKFDTLTSSTTYSIAVIWFLSVSGRRIKCPNVGTISTYPNHHRSEPQDLTIILSTIIPVIAALIAIAIVFSVVCILKMLRCCCFDERNYEVINANVNQGRN